MFYDNLEVKMHSMGIRIFQPLEIGPFDLSTQAGPALRSFPTELFDDLSKYERWEVALINRKDPGAFVNPSELKILKGDFWWDSLDPISLETERVQKCYEYLIENFTDREASKKSESTRIDTLIRRMNL